MMENVLKPLQDVAGVTGCFACTASGNVLVSALSHLTDEQVQAASSNLVNLFGAARDGITDCQRLTCQYEELTVEVLANESGYLCALVQRDCDDRLLHTVMRILARRVFGNARN